MRNLLYLFNNGYNAFPHLGKGGLGYKPPFKIIGDGLHLVFDTETKKYKETIDDLDNSDTNWYLTDYGTPEYDDVIIKRSENLLLEKERKEESLKKLEEGEKHIADLEARLGNIIYEDDNDTDTSDDEDDKAMKIKRIKETIKNMNKDVSKLPNNKLVETGDEVKKIINDIKTNINVKTKEKTKVKEKAKEKIKKEEEKNIQTPTTDEDKRIIRELLTSKYPTIKQTAIDAVLTKIFKNHPYITPSEFEKDMIKYVDEPYKEEKKEAAKKAAVKREENTDIRKVNKIKKEGSTENKGVAFERVMINDNQNELKQLSESDEDFKLASSNPIFYINGNFNTPIEVEFKGKLKPLHDLSLYDISNPKSIIDLKYYPTQEYSSIQRSKIDGSHSFTPCYEFKDNRYVLYNIWCNNTNSWVEKENYKDVSILSRLKDGNYNWSITNFINSIQDDNGKTNCPMKQVFINGKPTKYGKPDVINIFKTKGIDTYTRPNSTQVWFDIPKKAMFKTIPETTQKKSKKKEY